MLTVFFVPFDNAYKNLRNHIAQRLGYDNASKFSAAFRDVMGVTPQHYRNRQEDM
ncbi:MAG: AraC family transcriptional regulator [Oscillospiraceae bacterium]|nr:AraC family transcriptional regulator [Oscillospiraceae bacterium]